MNDLFKNAENAGTTPEGLTFCISPIHLRTQSFIQMQDSNMAGYANGYVGLPKGHPYYGKQYEEIPVDVHGGLTFSREIDGFWVVGFDVLHHGDSIATMSKQKCIEELMYLVEQLHPDKCKENPV